MQCTKVVMMVIIIIIMIPFVPDTYVDLLSLSDT